MKTKIGIGLFVLIIVLIFSKSNLRLASLDKDDPYRLLRAAHATGSLTENPSESAYLNSMDKSYQQSMVSFGRFEEAVTLINPETVTIKDLRRFAMELAEQGRASEAMQFLSRFENQGQVAKIKNLNEIIQPDLDYGKLLYQAGQGRLKLELTEKTHSSKSEEKTPQKSSFLGASQYSALMQRSIQCGHIDQAAELLLVSEEFKRNQSYSAGIETIGKVVHEKDPSPLVPFLQLVSKKQPALAIQLASRCLIYLTRSLSNDLTDLQLNEMVDHLLGIIRDAERESGATVEHDCRISIISNYRVNESTKSEIESELIENLKKPDFKIGMKIYLANLLRPQAKIRALQLLLPNCSKRQKIDCYEGLVHAYAKTEQISKSRQYFYLWAKEGGRFAAGRFFFLAAIECGEFRAARTQIEREVCFEDHAEEIEAKIKLADEYSKAFREAERNENAAGKPADDAVEAQAEKENVARDGDQDLVGQKVDEVDEVDAAILARQKAAAIENKEKFRHSRSRKFELLLSAAESNFTDPQPILELLSRSPDDEASLGIRQDELLRLLSDKILPKFVEQARIRQFEEILQQLPIASVSQREKYKLRQDVLAHLLQLGDVKKAKLYIKAVKQYWQQSTNSSSKRSRYHPVETLDDMLSKYYISNGNTDEAKEIFQSGVRSGKITSRGRAFVEPEWLRECLPEIKEMDQSRLVPLLKRSAYLLAEFNDVELAIECGGLIEGAENRCRFFLDVAKRLADKKSKL